MPDPAVSIASPAAIDAFGGTPAPLYMRLKAWVRHKIASGEWPTDSRIPSENTLVRDFGISRMTVHRALRELTEEGCLVRVHGVGTFVAGAKAQSSLIEVRNIADEIAERGHRHALQVIARDQVPAGAEAAAALGVAEGTPLFHSLILHLENDLPVQLEDRLVLPDAAPGYDRADFTQVTPHVFLSQVAPLSAAEHVVEAAVPSAAERRLLRLGAGEPVLVVHRRTWSADRAVSAARLVHPAQRYRLGGRFQPAPRRG